MAFCVGAVADTATTTSTAKKPAQTHASHAGTSHATSSHSTSAHSASSHGTAAHSTSHAKSSTAKAHTTTSKAQSGHTTSKSANKHSSRSKKTAKKRGQQVIDSDRARQIQEALIREHYLTGEPSGTWDSATQAAMQRYQADQGWQNKTTPDSRALIKLGLGPN
ncbi:MAG TPA: peptidoglycan-binding domain-containing protein, partial [Terriglobales bacterium]|nr:peptidoglycan-binding domain-containing protein [Terriglobales bacterium]